MNRIEGRISQIQKSSAIMLVDVDVDGHGFSALLIESAAHPEWLRTDNLVDLVFKETEVSLAKELNGRISLRNRMICEVSNLERGELISKVTLIFQNHTISSAITTRAVNALEIAIGDEVEALVKANEISLMKKE
jgi:molybdate transport system regulatory protein